MFIEVVKAEYVDDYRIKLFGKGKTWGNLIRMEAKMPKAIVSFWDGGEMRDHELTQGNLLYIYMVDKMTDGRMKLRRMGITEDDITRIENFLDPRFKALGDWLQDEFLVDTRNEYNETHKRMFGASMAAIENYFPLKILANARVDKEEDVNQQNRPDGITTKTGSIIKRRVNNIAIDITGADMDIAYGMSATFLFDMVMIVVFPILGRAMGLSDAAFGLWAGTAVNDTSSVVATCDWRRTR